MTLAWNVLDMPRSLTSGSASTQRSYLADGTLAQVSSGTSYRLYLGDLVFTRTGTTGTPVLESAAWEGGRLISGSGNGNVLYHVTDHLGSVRVVKDGAGTVRQRFDYYPYGSVSRVYTNSSTTDNSVKRYRFGGKEIAGTALTDLAGTGAAPGAPYLDFGARLYSPGTATWLSVDPMAEKFYKVSPYSYCHMDPLNRIDYDGTIDWKLFWKGAAATVGGVGTAIGGAAVTGATGGLAVPVGSVMVVNGVVGAGLGATYALIGLLTDPSEQNDKLMEVGPTSVTNTVTKSGDMMMGNEHHEIEIMVDLIEIIAGEGVIAGNNAHVIEELPKVQKALSKLGTIIQAGSVFKMAFDEMSPETGKQIELESEKLEQKEKQEWQGIKTFMNE